MSQVTRLKELLFDNETQALEALSRRIDTVAGAEQLAREVIRRELDTVLDRVGTTERFTRSVTEVIDEALEQAEVAKHTKLSATIAPLVVTTIKTELRNSQDEMVEALYPITGRLVKAYVASAIKDLNAELNRKIEQNAFMLRLQSLTTGRSVAELALAGGRNFKVEELFLIRRGSGELIAHWPETAGGGREQMMSGILAAINAFANEAFAADENSLRQIDLDTSTVYLRGSPIYLLAAKCAGTPPHGIEQVLDDAFLVAIEKEHEAETLAPDAAHERQHTLLKELEDRVEQENQRLVRPQGNPLKMIAALILIPLIGWFAWSSYARYANDSTERQAGDVLTQTAAMQGYPARFEASNMGRSLRISGLAPSEAVKGRLLGELAGVLPRTTLRDELSVVPGSGIIIPDRSKELEAVERSVQALKADMTANAVRRAVERTDLRLRQSAQDLRAARSSVETAKQTAIDEAAAFTGVAINELSSLRVLLASPENTDAARIAGALSSLAGRIEAMTGKIAGSLGLPQAMMADERRPAAQTAQPEAAAEALAFNAERLALAASLVALAKPAPAPPAVAAPPAPTPRALLVDWAARHAVFFGQSADYRDPAAVSAMLEELAKLQANAKVLLRVVGYTDGAGRSGANETLASERAAKVRDDLIARGADAGLVVAVGRATNNDLSTMQGPASPNRRVEFEVGFEGELP